MADIRKICADCNKPFVPPLWFHCPVCSQHGFGSTKGNTCTDCANKGTTKRKEQTPPEIYDLKCYDKYSNLITLRVFICEGCGCLSSCTPNGNRFGEGNYCRGCWDKY